LKVSGLGLGWLLELLLALDLALKPKLGLELALKLKLKLGLRWELGMRGRSLKFSPNGVSKNQKKRGCQLAFQAPSGRLASEAESGPKRLGIGKLGDFPICISCHKAAQYPRIIVARAMPAPGVSDDRSL
jgi:hypothetical protein